MTQEPGQKWWLAAVSCRFLVTVLYTELSFVPSADTEPGSKLALSSGPWSGFKGGQVPVPGREAALALAWGLAMGPLSQMSCKYHLAGRKRKEEL